MHLEYCFTIFSSFEQYNEDSDDEDEDVDKAAAQPESLEVPYYCKHSFTNYRLFVLLKAPIAIADNTGISSHKFPYGEG